MAMTAGTHALHMAVKLSEVRSGDIVLCSDLKVIPAIVYLCLFCTAVALLLQNYGQKHTTPSTASLLLSLESVFGTMFSAMLGREDLTIRMICGFVTIFLSIIVSETKLSFFERKPA